MDAFESLWRKRGRPITQQDVATKTGRSAHFVTMTNRDYTPLTKDDDVVIKFWLPELLGTIIEETSSMLKITRSDLVRQLLFSYLYGRYDWLGFFERRAQEPARTIDVGRDEFSVPTFMRLQSDGDEKARKQIVKDLGKNIEDLKVWIPRKIKEDIDELAGKANLSCSEMIREIMLSSLIGHTYLPARSELLQIKIELEDRAR